MAQGVASADLLAVFGFGAATAHGVEPGDDALAVLDSDVPAGAELVGLRRLGGAVGDDEREVFRVGFRPAEEGGDEVHDVNSKGVLTEDVL